MLIKILKTIGLTLILLGLVGCSAVRPWERNILAKDEMLLVPDELESYVDDHVFFSKEASTGGKGVGGGGCGCN